MDNSPKVFQASMVESNLEHTSDGANEYTVTNRMPVNKKRSW